MNQKQYDFVKLLSGATLGKLPKLTDCNFNAMESLVISHYCASLVAYGASLCGVNVPKEWADAATIVLFNNYRNLSAQKEILRILKDNSIKGAVIKGITAAVNYPNPMSRALGDVDILISPSDYIKAMDLFGVSPEDNKHHFHFSFEFQGVSVEIHRAIDEYDKCVNGEKLSSEMKNALDDIKYITFDGFEVPALSPKYQAIVYLNHMIRHFDENELSMRMFCDWVAFVNKIDNETWFNEIYPLIKEVGYDCYSDAMNLAAEKYFGANTKVKAMHKFPDKLLEDFMEDFVYESKRKGDDFLNGNVVTEYLKNREGNDSFLKMSIRLLNSIAYNEFYISKYKIALPLCWIYILIRYVIRVLFGKRKIVSYKRIANDVKRREYIKSSLNINRA